VFGLLALELNGSRGWDKRDENGRKETAKTTRLNKGKAENLQTVP
jgi:hypothetical protein